MSRLEKGELPPLTFIYTTCKICNKSKDDAYFKYQKGKRAGLVCRECDLKIKRDRYNTDETEHEKIKTKSRKWTKENPELSRIRSKNYRMNNDKKHRENKANYHKNNSEKINAKSKAWYELNKNDPTYREGRKLYNKNNAKEISETQATYFQNNKENIKSKNKLWRKANKQLLNFYTRQYNMNKEKRTPLWANLEKIREIYLNCPDGYVVDHIVPLHGKIVSGLHVHTNLQYLTKLENSIKSNKFSN